MNFKSGRLSHTSMTWTAAFFGIRGERGNAVHIGDFAYEKFYDVSREFAMGLLDDIDLHALSFC